MSCTYDVQQHIISLIENVFSLLSTYKTQMITGDMFTFAIIYIIVLFGFSQAYFFLYKGHESVEDTPYYSYMSTWMGLFQTTLGDYDVSKFFFPIFSDKRVLFIQSRTFNRTFFFREKSP